MSALLSVIDNSSIVRPSTTGNHYASKTQRSCKFHAQSLENMEFKSPQLMSGKKLPSGIPIPAKSLKGLDVFQGNLRNTHFDKTKREMAKN